MRDFGSLRRIKTHACIRTARSIRGSIGPGQGTWLRVQDGERLATVIKRLQVSRRPRLQPSRLTAPRP